MNERASIRPHARPSRSSRCRSTLGCKCSPDCRDGDLGEKDTIIPVEHAYAAQNAREGSRVEVLPGVGHFAQVEAPTTVVDLIEDFIATTSTAEMPSRQPSS